MTMANEEQRVNRLCELNVLEQVRNVGNTTIVQEVWRKGSALTIHGWIYGIENGLLKDLRLCISSVRELQELDEK